MLVTPWGEALIRRWYQDGLAELSHLPQITRVRGADQPVGAARLDRRDADPERLALWCTYHPEWTTHDDVRRAVPHARRARASATRVGVVGQREYRAAARALRAALPADDLRVDQRGQGARLHAPTSSPRGSAIDPLFALNTQRWPSLGERAAPASARSRVDGDGTMRRCHFIAEPIGNLYEPGLGATRSRRARARRSTATATSATCTSTTSSSTRCSRPACSSASRCPRRAARPACGYRCC